MKYVREDVVNRMVSVWMEGVHTPSPEHVVVVHSESCDSEWNIQEDNIPVMVHKRAPYQE